MGDGIVGLGGPGGWELALALVVLLGKLALILLVVSGSVAAIVLVARSRKRSQPSPYPDGYGPAPHSGQSTTHPGQDG